MELTYQEHYLREYELTKHVSLLQIDPLALISLRATGRCVVRVPEALFDLDGPGHYFRRVKTVSLSIPCVTGAYAGVSCKLTLVKSSIRESAVAIGTYARESSEDTRFRDYYGSQSIVASSGQQDSGLFETNLRDERYLPFENAGVISEWQVELPANPSQDDPTPFDYDTIADVILFIRYTARDGGEQLRSLAIAQLKELIAEGEVVGSKRLFSVRHEFPAEWARFTTQVPPANHRYALRLLLRPEHYPFWSQGRVKAVTRVDVLARSNGSEVLRSLEIASRADTAGETDVLTRSEELGGLLVGKYEKIDMPAPVGDFKLFVAKNALSDLWIGLTWTAA